MEVGVTKRDTGRARRGHTRPNKQVGPDQPSRKRRRSAEDEDSTGHTRKSPRIQESSNKRRRTAENKSLPQPRRKSLRLQKIRDLSGPEQPQSDCRILRVPRNSKRRKTSQYQAPPVPTTETSTPAPASPRPLTSANLKLLSRAMPSDKDRESKSSRSRPKSKSSHPHTKSSKSSRSTISTTDSSFPLIAFENGVLDPVHSTPPENLNSLQKRFNRARDTKSPSESEYENFVRKAQKAPNEMTMLIHTSNLLKPDNVKGYSRVYNQAFNNFPKDVGFNNGLSAAQPDMVEGLDLTEFEPFLVRRHFSGAAIPTLEPDPPTLPHLAGEWKGPGKDMIRAQRQSAYDGASMVYGRDEACSYLGRSDPPNHAFVSSFTTDGTTINSFAHYSTTSQNHTKYHQYPITSSFLTTSFKDYKKGRRQLRNQQDYAKENSETLRNELIDKWSTSQQHIEDEDDEDNYNDDGYFPPPKSQGIQVKTADSEECDGYDSNDQYGGEDDPSSQLLTEYYASFMNDNQHEDEENSFVQIPTPDASSSTSRPRATCRKKKRLG